MKTKMMIVALAVVATTMFSCKKEYTCKCNRIYTDSTATTTRADGSYILKDNASRAETQCNKQEYTGADLYGSYSRQCSID